MPKTGPAERRRPTGKDAPQRTPEIQKCNRNKLKPVTIESNAHGNKRNEQKYLKTAMAKHVNQAKKYSNDTHDTLVKYGKPKKDLLIM